MGKCSGLYPLIFPAWVALPGAYTLAGRALKVIDTHKPPHHGKEWTVWRKTGNSKQKTQAIDNKQYGRQMCDRQMLQAIYD